MRRFRVPWGMAWKVLLRVSGLFIILHEALSSAPDERPFLYVVAAAMMGITVTIPADKKRRNGDG